MASIIDMIMGPIQSILNLINSPLATVIILLLAVVAVAGLYLWIQVKPVKKVLYFSPEENQGQEFTVERMTPAFLYTKKSGGDRYQFIRFRPAWTFQVGWKNITRWLATKGTAYAKKLETGEVGNFTLFKVMKSIWGDDVIEGLQDDQKQKLIESQVMITVKLEEGTTPKGHKAISEFNIKKETDAEMARIFGDNISREFAKEDWIRSAALVGCGVALCYVAQAMGLIGGVVV